MLKIKGKHIVPDVWLAMVAIVLMGMAAVSCAGDGCTSGTSSVPRAGFYASSTGDAISIDSLSVYGVDVPGDSMLLRCARSVHQTYMPLRISQGSTRYVLHYDQKAICDERNNDTITIAYDAKPLFVSDECGVIYVYDITDCKYTNHILESVELVYPHVSNYDVEALKLYFKTDE